MGKIVISTNVSLDGVVQDPDGSEGLPFGGWFPRFGGTDLEEWGKVMLDDALDTDALLLGRRTDAWFAERWLSRTGAWAERLNGLPKYVVSSTIDAPRWGVGAVLSGDVAAAVAKLKREVDGNIVVFGSYRLVPHAHRTRPRRRSAPDGLPRRTRRGRAPLRRHRRSESIAPRRLPGHRCRPRAREVRGRAGGVVRRASRPRGR